MPYYKKILILYFAVINLLAIFITISDKRRAVKHKWRVPESTLLLFSALGGSPAMFLTMKLIHHKTKHKKFMIGIPIILFLQLAAAGVLVYFWR